MKLSSLVAAAALVFAGNASAAEPINWQRYIVAETGASVDIPTSVFTEDAGKPEGAYGKQFLTSDGRANLTIESLTNEARDSPATFLAKRNPPKDIVYKKITSRFFRGLELPQRQDLVRPLQLRRFLGQLRLDQLPGRRKTWLGWHCHPHQQYPRQWKPSGNRIGWRRLNARDRRPPLTTTAHVADSQRPLGPAVQNERTRG